MAAIDYFPLPTPRAPQVEALEFIENALDDGYQDVIVEAPTGFGKTAVGATLCRWMSTPSVDPLMQPGGYILVVQKALQDQIANDLGRFGTGGFSAELIKSAIEYACPSYKFCGLALKPCKARKAGTCPYRNAKERFLASALGVTNYAYFLTDAAYVKSMLPRKMLVLDEAHNLEKTLTSLVGIEISEETLEHTDPKLAEELTCLSKNRADFIDWLGERYLPDVHERVLVMAELASDGESSVEDAIAANNAKQEYERVSVAYQRLRSNPEGWVYWHDRNDNTNNLTILCKPIDVGPYFHDYFDRFPKRVFMSAFIGRKDVFCRQLDLDPALVAHYRVSSDFDKERRPIHILNAGSLSKSNREENLPKVLNVVIKIAQQQPERGVIHTHSYAFANAVADALRGAGMAARVTYPDNVNDREAALEHHAITEGSILISPSLFEGFDFAYDLCRWQIVLKCQFASMGDEVVKARMKRDREWYRMETLKSFIQTCGRGMRAKDDSCITYALDSDISRMLSDTKADIPPWFLEALDFR